MDIAAMLRETAFFKNLEPAELDAVTKCVVEQAYQPGEVVIQEGVPGDALYLVVNGRVKVEKESDGKRLGLAELGPGQAFGEMSLIDSFPTSATVTALEPAVLLAIGRLDLNVLLNWNPILAAKMWRSFTEMLSFRLREMNERMLARFGDQPMGAA